jgi:hypothetical protein
VADEAKNSKPKDLTDAELLSWARKRGVVTFFIFFSIAVGVAVWWYLSR